MTINEWRKSGRHNLSHREAGEILGITEASSCARGGRPASGPLEAFFRVVGTMPRVAFSCGSFHQPLAHFDGGELAHGPADVIRGDGRIAAHVVALWALMPERTEDEYQTAKRFLLYWAEGPHLR